MQDNPERGELDPAVDIRRRYKKNSSSVISCRKRTKESCDRGSEMWTVHSGRGGEGPVPLKKLREPGKREKIVRKISSPGGIAGTSALSLQ